LPASVRQYAEILVFCQQNPRFRMGQGENDVIARRRAEFCDGRDIMTGVTQRPNNHEIAAFIS